MLLLKEVLCLSDKLSLFVTLALLCISLNEMTNFDSVTGRWFLQLLENWIVNLEKLSLGVSLLSVLEL